MSLEKGHKLGPYEIEATVGAGGMGEVYRARDSRLGRAVAIKVLPRRMALDSDARARFEREAKTISSLNHPNICTLYDVGHENGIDFLVMECLEGESLADRLTKGKLDTAFALSSASRIASALEVAHRKGIIHRDLKPGNIYLTKDGAKLLDFGLAKLHAEAVTGMNDRTETTPVTGAGAIVGTLQYMSPEQLEGREADPRSDIFSFGATLYEMVTGRRAFSGTSKASLIGSIMKDEPRSITEFQPTSPPALDRLIKKCLAKDPDDRWQSAKDLKDELDWIASVGTQAGIPATVSSKRRFRVKLTWAATLIVLFTVGPLSIVLFRQEEASPRTVRFKIPRPAGAASMEWPSFSPDGSMIAFVGTDSSGVRRIWVRDLAASEPYVLSGTEGVFHPIWSPDSKYLAFFTGSRLKKVACAGGPVQVICETSGEDGTWNEEDLILFDAFGPGISGVSAADGTPRRYLMPDPAVGEAIMGFPWFLPDGEHFLYASIDSAEWAAFTGGERKATIKVASTTSPAVRTILKANSRAEYCAPGFLLYVKNSTLLAHPFDAEKLQLRGDPIPLAFGVWSPSKIDVEFSASNSGGLALATGGLTGGVHPGYLVRVSRSGQVIDTIGGRGVYGDASFSPEDTSVAYSSFPSAAKSYDITVYNLRSKSEMSITRDDFNDVLPVWSPDGQSIAYGYQSGLQLHVRRQKLADAGRSERVSFTDSLTVAPVQWTEKSGLLLQEAVTTDLTRTPRAWLCSGDRQEEARLLLDGPLRETVYGLSPDGRYLLEVLHSERVREVYLLDLDNNRARIRVAPDDGDYPRWRRDGREIYYVRSGDLMAVPVSFEPVLSLGPPERLFTLEVHPRWKDAGGDFMYFGYDATTDGREFLVVKAAAVDASSAECEVILNWPAALAGD